MGQSLYVSRDKARSFVTGEFDGIMAGAFLRPLGRIIFDVGSKHLYIRSKNGN
jgi:hypothetical protein